MEKESMLEKGLYKELSESDGLTILFRKFESNTWIFQYIGNLLIGTILLDNNDLEYIFNVDCIKDGDGKSPQL